MIIRHCTTALLLWLGCSCLAAPLKLDSLKVGTLTYSNVTVIGANPTDLYFTHAQGIANVKLKYLSSDLQKQFNYDPAVAAEAEKRQIEADQSYQAALASHVATQSGTNKTAAVRVGNVSSEENLADPIAESSLLGKAAPPVEPEKWLTDKPATEGKFVLIEFWAPWSYPSRNSIPELNALQKKFANKLVVVGVSSEAEGEVSNLAEPKIEYASAVDSKGKLSSAAGVTSIPTVMLIDTNGIVRYEGHPAALTEKRLQAFMAAKRSE